MTSAVQLAPIVARCTSCGRGYTAAELASLEHVGTAPVGDLAVEVYWCADHQIPHRCSVPAVRRPGGEYLPEDAR